MSALTAGIEPSPPRRLRPGSKVRQQLWCDDVKRTLMKRPGEWFLIRRYRSATGAWTARGIWSPLMPGVEWLAQTEREGEHRSALRARWPENVKDYGRRAGGKRDRKL